MDNSAIVPESPVLMSDEADQAADSLQPFIQKDIEKAKLLTTEGYDQIVQILDRHIDNFRTGKGMAIDSKTPLAEVGQKFIIASTIATICAEIKADVINAANGVLDGSGK